MSQQPVPDYLLPDSITVSSKGELEIGGCGVIDLAEEYGTPLMIYEEDHIRKRLAEAGNSFDAASYATKAFLCKHIARLATEENLLLDVASFGEMMVVLKAGIDPSNLVFHGNNRSLKEMALALENQVGKIVIDSDNDIYNLESLLDSGIGGDKPINVLIRVTPGIQANTHDFVKTGHKESKFGFSVSTKAANFAIEHLLASKFFNLLGLHFHIGSQIFELDSYKLAIMNVAELMTRYELSELCIGGGLGIPYVTGDPVISITQWASEIKNYVKTLLPSSVKITAEPGRSIVGLAGITVYKIGVIKKVSENKTYVAVDGGMSENPRPMIYGSNYEAFLPRAFRESRPEPVTVVGKHCESGDIIVKNGYLPADFSSKDYLAVPATGAYSYSMASNYNRLPRPAVVFVKSGEAKLVIRRETVDDMLSTDMC